MLGNQTLLHAVPGIAETYCSWKFQYLGYGHQLSSNKLQKSINPDLATKLHTSGRKFLVKTPSVIMYMIP